MNVISSKVADPVVLVLLNAPKLRFAGFGETEARRFLGGGSGGSEANGSSSSFAMLESKFTVLSKSSERNWKSLWPFTSADAGFEDESFATAEETAIFVIAVIEMGFFEAASDGREGLSSEDTGIHSSTAAFETLEVCAGFEATGRGGGNSGEDERRSITTGKDIFKSQLKVC